MAPGMGHCGGGNGPSSFDMLTALEAWVEEGAAPNSVLAERQRDGRVDRTRPALPLPGAGGLQRQRQRGRRSQLLLPDAVGVVRRVNGISATC